jgi:hypothetical protein
LNRCSPLHPSHDYGKWAKYENMQNCPADCVKQINLGNYLKYQLGQMEMNQGKLPVVEMRRFFLNLDWTLTVHIINFTI